MSDPTSTARLTRSEAFLMKTWLTPITILAIAHACSAQWMPQESGTRARLRGLGVVSREVAWAVGNGGTCLLHL